VDGEGTRIVQVELANGATMFVEAVGTKSGGMASVALPAKLDFDNVLGTLGELGSAVVDKLKVAGPSRATVELKFGFVAEPGKLTALLVSGKADASLTVTLEWSARREKNGQGDG
jgi:Trypsin-co-occurring domain 1